MKTSCKVLNEWEILLTKSIAPYMFIYHEDIQLQRMLFNSACFHCAQNIVFPIYDPGNTAYYGPILSIILLSFSGISALCIFTFLCCYMIMPVILRLNTKSQLLLLLF